MSGQQHVGGSPSTLGQDDAGEGHPLALAGGTGARLALLGKPIKGSEDAVGNGIGRGVHRMGWCS